MTSILITGGAGFIGSNIADFLCKNDTYRHIRIVDNLSTGKLENIQHLIDNYKNVEFIYGDISNLETCKKVVSGIHIICHQAALGSVPRSIIDPLSSHISNVNGFLNILLAAKEEGIKRIIYASSSSVYGDNDTLPKIETTTGNVLSPYAATKAIDEIYAKVFASCYGMECIGLRYFNVFGPRQDPNGAYAAVIPKFIKLFSEGKSPVINGDGSFSRDFTYIDNVVQANMLALTTTNTHCFGEVFNIGAGGQISILDLVNNIKKEFNCVIEPVFTENRPGDIPHSNADISKAKKMLGYEPKISFEAGIKRLINFVINKNNNILNIENIDLNKLLNREPFNLQINVNNLKDKKILITGGAGSIGSELILQLMFMNIINLFIIDTNEYGIHNIKNKINRIFPSNNIKFYLRDINNYDSMNKIFLEIKPEIIFHAAAYKHVPIMEDNPNESINTNIHGTKVLANLSLKYNVDKFLYISTDKAVNPTSIMGVCKRISELYLQHLNKNNTTEFIITRFGNVIGSSGSVIPTFIDNINNNVNIKLTHKDIIRYFITISEAIQLVILSINIGKGGDILLFDMGKPIKIIDLANNILKLSNKPHLSIEIIGLMAGEKLYEELLCNNENSIPTDNSKILLLKHNEIEDNNFIELFNILLNTYKELDIKDVKLKLKELVSEYTYI